MLYNCKECAKRKHCIYKPTSDVADCGYFVSSKQEQKQKQTQADRIRAMSDEELAELLDTSCIENRGRDICIGDCKLCNLQWLKSEVKE